ncbi:putative n-alpha-acetyltransferase auxiliary subunit [Rosellinia necatrix]|uniref:Putative n-alpha-acetyltransferase auxiliary subunit n=1 Tax=Rosellinia necatrix TaxID=77044 RepID=A0A1W2TP04_ROSNE|nr:putative n-alpha-acetyltransferase auxiliary subunit [Rosellinia necatrix]
MQPLEPPMPPPPNISHPGIMAIDITDQFASAVKTLSPGEIVKDEHFELFESVSALEIMDRKMDSGVLSEGESLDEEYDVTRALLPEEVLGIIDQLLCLEIAWHLGYPLSQTVLTSVYIEALMNPYPVTVDEVDFRIVPSRQSGKSSLLFVLRAYCAGLSKACFMVNECMKEELYYEEEDFVTNTYERHLLSHIPLPAIKDMLQNAITKLQTLGDEFPQDICAALASRLELRIAFLEAIDLSVVRHDTSDAPKLPWIRMRRLIDDFEKQHALGKPVPEAFSTKMQRRLTSTMPPRPMVKLSFEECISHFKRFLQNGNEVIDVLQYKDPQSLLNFILLFQAQKPQPLVFIRTILQNLLFRDMVVLGQFSIRQLLDHDVSLGVLPCGPHFDRTYDDIEIPTDPRHKIATTMEVFRHRVADLYLDMLRILCQNRCRVRRTLCHHILEWDMLEADVGEIEERMQAPLHDVSQGAYQEEGSSYLPLSSWVYLYRLRQMEWIVQLGFELGIYQFDELAGMYYYLKRLASLRAQHIELVKRTTTNREERARQHFKLREGDPLPPDVAQEFMRSKQHLRVTMLDAACTWEFADGLGLLYVALFRLGILKPPPRPYATNALSYELRMRPFSRVTYPPLPSYEEFRQQIELPQMSTTDVLRIAETAISAVRKGYEASVHLSEPETFVVNATAHTRLVSNAKDTLRATIAAGVAVSTLKHAYEKAVAQNSAADGGGNEASGHEDSKYAKLLNLKAEIPEPGTGYHDWWVVPKLTRLK